MKVCVNLTSESSGLKLYLMILDKIRDPKEIDQKALEVAPKLYTGSKPKRSIQAGQIVQLIHERYPKLFVVHDVFKNKQGDEIAIVYFNWDEIENPEDINR